MKRVPPLVAGLVLSASVLMSQASAPPAHADIPTTENAFVAAVNSLRASRGVAPLAVDVRLTNLARSWAGQMGAAGRLADNPNLAAQMPAGWTMIGENVGEGPNWAVIESALEHDAPHLVNMIQPGFNAIGVGVAMVGSQMWMAEEFMGGAPIVSAVPPPAPPTFGLSVGWTGWRAEAAGAPGMVGGPAVATWGPGRFDEFARDNVGRLWHRWSRDGGASYSGWEGLSTPAGGLMANPAVVSWGPGRIDLLAVGANRAIWHLSWQGQWSGWQDLGGGATSAPAVSSWGPGRLDVFVVGADNAVWHKALESGAWSGWESRGGRSVTSPAAASWGFNRVDVFTVGGDGGLWHQWWDGQRWSEWTSGLPGNWSAGPAAAAWAPGRVDVSIPSNGTGRPLTHFFWNGSWHVDSLGGTITAAPAEASWAPNRLDEFVRGADGLIYHDTFPVG